MGSSAKRKKEKAKDFAKPKLKVGKTAAKPANHTSTSFKAKSIVLNQQSLTSSAPDSTTQFVHNLSLVSSKSHSQKHDALASLTHALQATKSSSRLETNTPVSDVEETERPRLGNASSQIPCPISTLLDKILPILIDGSKSVRQQTLKLLHALPPDEIAGGNVELLGRVIMWIHVALTHLAVEIKSTGLEALEWVLLVAGAETVGTAGAWVKTLRILLTVLGWKPKDEQSRGAGSEGEKRTDGGWSSVPSSTTSSGAQKVGGDSKLRARQITGLAKFLEAGLREANGDDLDCGRMAARVFPLMHTDRHVIGTKSSPFGYLNLFGAVRNEESEVYDDVDGRREIYLDLLHSSVIRGLHESRKEGGEVGRAAAALAKVLSGAMIE